MEAEELTQSTPAPSMQGPGANEAAGPVRREVRVTAEAVTYAKKRLAARGTPDAAIRLGVRGGGCSGFNYVIEFSDDPPRAKDAVSEFDGVKFYVDKKSLIYLAGSTLDYEHTLMFQGFRFRNPQEATRCGCGHSFTVR
jgi:iron-sulfur cluster assembly protein